jgi:hypothetical protein
VSIITDDGTVATPVAYTIPTQADIDGDSDVTSMLYSLYIVHRTMIVKHMVIWGVCALYRRNGLPTARGSVMPSAHFLHSHVDVDHC